MAKVGRPRNVETPEELYELFKKYKQDIKSNPRIKSVFGGKEFEERAEPLERPLTMEGFRVFCFKNQGCIKDYFDNKDNRYSEYATICTHIRDLIRQDQALTLDPNVGGFGQTEKEIVLQDPTRIIGFVGFSILTMLTQIMLVLKKKQFEKVQAAEMNF